MANKGYRRKSNQIKTKESKKIDTIDNFDGNIWSKLIVGVSVICFLLAFYLLTLYITNKNTEKSDDSKDKEEVTISNENIIVGRALSISDEDYLVVFYDKGDENISSTYSSLVSSYKAKNAGKIYTVDMSSGLNKRFLTDGESNKNPSNESEFKINGPTLIRVSSHTVVDYIEGEEAITEYLN